MTFNNKMHERNIYRNRPDFAKIALEFPLFRKYATPDAKGKVYVDFTNTDALRMLTKILLKKDFNLDVEIPEGFLIPTIPQRLNYILWVEDLVADVSLKNKHPTGIDIGAGPCAIFALLGAQKNGWSFIATDSADDAIYWAKKNIEKNELLSKISVLKVYGDSPLSEILLNNETYYEFCLCNPPFYENPNEVRKKHQRSKGTIADVAQVKEIFYEGGEVEFVRNIVKDSIIFKKRICLFTSMFGKKSSFLQILKELKEIKDVKVTTTEFCQGNTVRWGIAWTFDKSVQFEEIKKEVKPKKAKPPLKYEIPVVSKSDEKIIVDRLLQIAQNILKELEIPTTTIKSTKNYAELLLKSNKNTWTHQRRKRRELERQKRDVKASENTLDRKNPAFDSNIPSNKASSASAVPSIDSENNNSLLKSKGTESCSKLESYMKQDVKDVGKFTSEDNNSSFKTVLELSESLLNADDVGVSKNEASVIKSHENILTGSEDKHNMHEDSNCKMSSVKIENFSDSSITKQKASNEIEMTEIKLEKKSDNEQDSNTYLDNKRKMDCSHDDLCESKKKKIKQGDHVSDSSVSSNQKQNEDFSQECSLQLKNIKLHQEDDMDVDQGTVLHCHLQLIKGRNNKVYVKMNCPPSADRSSMYQVFQIIKNKLK